MSGLNDFESMALVLRSHAISKVLVKKGIITADEIRQELELMKTEGSNPDFAKMLDIASKSLDTLE